MDERRFWWDRGNELCWWWILISFLRKGSSGSCNGGSGVLTVVEWSGFFGWGRRRKERRSLEVRTGDKVWRGNPTLLSFAISGSIRAEVLVRGPLAKVKAKGRRSFNARQKSLFIRSCLPSIIPFRNFDNKEYGSESGTSSIGSDVPPHTQRK